MANTLAAPPPPPMLVEEADAINAAIREPPLLSSSLVMAAWRGQETRVLELIGAGIQDAPAPARRRAIALAQYASAMLYNGLCRYEAALTAARRACERGDLELVDRALPELVEAAVRNGDHELAEAAVRRFERRMDPAGPGWAPGLRAQCHALVSDGADADVLYQDALERLICDGSALQLARARLLYGEWLRREGRRTDARMQLRAAHGAFSLGGAGGYAERARRELVATGETARKRTAETRDELTPRETQIAHLAGDGYTNSEIADQLFLSRRTVEWHLRRVFRKLEISSRRELRRAVPREV